MKKLIALYVQNMTINDAKRFLEKNQIKASDHDLEIILDYSKKYWEQIYEGDTSIFEKIKKDIAPDTYQTMINLYEQYKGYIS